MKNVLVVFGSMTPEHDLSCKSAATIIEHIDRERFNPVAVGITKDGKWLYTEAALDEIADARSWENSSTNRKAQLDLDNGSGDLLVFDGDRISDRIHIDCVFARIAGRTGEDGSLQGLFEIAGLPYVGCDVASSACSMDKSISYLFAQSIGIRCPRTAVVLKDAYSDSQKSAIGHIKEALIDVVGYPVFVKPAGTGSSIGISKVSNDEDLATALESAFAFDEKVVIEEGIEGDEIKVALLGNDDPIIAPLCKLNAGGDFNDFETKYIAKSSAKEIPANIAPEAAVALRRAALDLYELFGCSGFSRIDFFLDEQGSVIFNELNSMPGFQPTSLYPVLMKEAGITYKELISRLIELAMESFGERRMEA